MLSKILVPVAFSERCRGAALYAERLAQQFRGELVLLHVVTPIPAYGYSDVQTISTDITAEMSSAAKVQLGRFADEWLKNTAATQIVIGL